MFKVTMKGKTFSLDEKTPIISLIEKEDEKKYFVAKVNNRLRELTYELCYDCEVELLDNSDPDAVKVYETSLRYLIAMAYHNIFPDYDVKISYNISRSLLVSILTPDNIVADSKLIKKIKDEMNRLVNLDIPFNKKTKTKEEAHKYYL